jgi:hypothetical protein
VISVGLLDEIGLTAGVAEMGCDVYVHNSRQALQAVRQLAQRWKRRRRVASPERARIDSSLRISDRDAWTWGTDKMPAELESLLANTDEVERNGSLTPNVLIADEPSTRRVGLNELSLFSPRRAGGYGVELRGPHVLIAENSATRRVGLERALSLLSAPCRRVRRGLHRGLRGPLRRLRPVVAAGFTPSPCLLRLGAV